MLTTAGADVIPNDGLMAGSLAKKASLALQQPLQDNSRQHSWTAGRPAPKYQPPANPILTPAQLHPVPGTSSGLQPLEEEEQSQAHSPSMLSPRQMGLVQLMPPVCGRTATWVNILRSPGNRSLQRTHSWMPLPHTHRQTGPSHLVMAGVCTQMLPQMRLDSH